MYTSSHIYLVIKRELNPSITSEKNATKMTINNSSYNDQHEYIVIKYVLCNLNFLRTQKL